MNRTVNMESRLQKPGFLFVLPWDIRHVGGVNQVVNNLFREALREARFRPLLLMADWQDARLREDYIDGQCHVYYRLRSPWNKKNPVRTAVSFAASFPRTIVTLASFLRKHRVSVVNIHYPTLGMLPFAILKWLGVYKGKLIVSLHGADLRGANASAGQVKCYWRTLFRNSDAIVACSARLAQEARECFPGCADRIKHVHNGLDLERLLTERDRDFALDPRLRSGGFILNVAKFEYKKGQDVLLRAFREISKKYPELNLVMIGASGPNKHALTALTEDLGLKSRVFIYEELPHECICAFMEKALVFTLPSRDEPFGIVLLEAGAMKVAVVASRVGGVPEIIVDNESGLLVDPEDSEGL